MSFKEMVGEIMTANISYNEEPNMKCDQRAFRYLNKLLTVAKAAREEIDDCGGLLHPKLRMALAALENK